MTKLDNFVSELKENIPLSLKNNKIGILRYAYTKLGSILKWDHMYFLGNSKIQKNIIRKIENTQNSIHYYFEYKYCICLVISDILSYVLNSLNFDAYTTILDGHGYTIVNIDSNIYTLDLHCDLYRIHAKRKTKYFIDESNENIIDPEYLREIDIITGYIDTEGYTEEKLANYTSDMSTLTLEQKIEVLIKKTYQLVDVNSMGFLERYKFIKYIFRVYDYILEKSQKIYFSCCKYTLNNVERYVSIISVSNFSGSFSHIIDKTSNSQFFYIFHEDGSVKRVTRNEIISLIKNDLKIRKEMLFIDNKLIKKENDARTKLDLVLS
ncbi:MAG: hypothetical protein N2749_02315 [Clostridia bacterium]|nr:hypothetical protein [Clostridia bacterium]